MNQNPFDLSAQNSEINHLPRDGIAAVSGFWSDDGTIRQHNPPMAQKHESRGSKIHFSSRTDLDSTAHDCPADQNHLFPGGFQNPLDIGDLPLDPLLFSVAGEFVFEVQFDRTEARIPKSHSQLLEQQTHQD